MSDERDVTARLFVVKRMVVKKLHSVMESHAEGMLAYALANANNPESYLKMLDFSSGV